MRQESGRHTFFLMLEGSYTRQPTRGIVTDTFFFLGENRD